MRRISHIESERMCEAAFLKSGEWWHLYTPGNLTALIFTSNDGYRFAMNLMARCAAEFSTLKIAAFEIMSNHLHIVLCGDKNIIQEFFDTYRRRLKRFLAGRGQVKLPSQFQMEIKPIEDLKALRNTIVYVNRNGYVVNPGHTPFSYPWGTGAYYFNTFPVTGKLSELTDKEIRRMFRSRNPHLPDGTTLADGFVLPTEYCDVRLGMSMFRDAHQYFFMVSRNVESYETIASELGDSEYVTDTELFPKVCQLIKSDYGHSVPKDLSPVQKMDIAKRLRKDYRSSNGQIRRVLGLSQYEVDSLFPLSAP